MRVLHVHERAGFSGGVEQILYDTARGLAARGWPQGLLHADSAPQGEYLSAFDTAATSDALIADFAPDLLFLHKVEDPTRVAALAARLPTVRMVHDHDLVCLRRHKYFPRNSRVCDRPAGIACYLNLCFVQRAPAGSRVPVALRGLSRVKAAIRANRGLRRLMVGSRWMADELSVNGLDPARIAIVPPIPAALAQASPLPASGEAEVLFVGQVIRGKGVDLLLRALSSAPARLPGNWHATVVGTGNHLEACRTLAEELGIGPRVTFAGWVPHQALEPYYARAAVCVVPSRWPEPFGMVGVEAMARGRPVVAFGVGGIPDWLDDGVTGILAPQADTAALGAAMADLLADPARAQALGRAGVERVRERFQPDRYLARLMQILEEAAGETT
jgi:glycosyltransferase involved in cell wall biosynthesis